MSLIKTTRWGLARRVLIAGGLAVVAVPTGLSAAAFAAPAPPNPVANPAPDFATGLPGSFAPDFNPHGGPGGPGPKGFWGGKTDDQVAAASGQYQAAADPGSLYTVTGAIGARQVWGQKDSNGRAITGQGVSVALLDSGVAPVAGLDAAGKIVQGPDLSLETNSPDLQGLDDFGHGTFLAGLIAAHDPTATDRKSGAPTKTTPGDQLGVAPDAGVVALKLATANGSTDVSEVIAGLDWVTQHAQDNGNNIRVVNLSFGTDSVQPYQLDPLAAAAENAWHHGIVVVVSGGNEGAAAGRLTDPAIDPYVIAVGASDPNASINGWAHPGVASFSSVGNAGRHVDLVAPGKSVVGLRDPGSYIDTNNPQGLVAGDSSGRLFRGSGTSQAAAVVSGSVALLEQENPSITPDQVKAALMATARPLAGVDPLAQGAGELDVNGAAALVRTFNGKIGPAQAAMLAMAVQNYPVATGLGSLEAARGGSNLVDPDNGIVLQGEVDVQGQPWDPAAWSAASAAGTAWTGGVWNSARWSGDGWSGADWQSAAWTSARWSGVAWSAADWDSARWSSARWSSARWSSARWSAADWDSARWSSARWSSARWSAADWA